MSVDIKLKSYPKQYLRDPVTTQKLLKELRDEYDPDIIEHWGVIQQINKCLWTDEKTTPKLTSVYDQLLYQVALCATMEDGISWMNFEADKAFHEGRITKFEMQHLKNHVLQLKNLESELNNTVPAPFGSV